MLLHGSRALRPRRLGVVGAGGSDSALAAPLVLDLVRLVDLAGRAGQSGALGQRRLVGAKVEEEDHDDLQSHQQTTEPREANTDGEWWF